MKPDKLTMGMYYDVYGDLLTGKQRECLELYCNQDFTLAEIAELQGTSRQSVYDAISRAQAQLMRLEEVTHSLANQQRRARLAARLEEAARQLQQQGIRSIPAAAACMETAARELKE